MGTVDRILFDAEQIRANELQDKLDEANKEIERLQAEVNLWVKCAGNFQKDMRSV